jgi:hypothetical protein
MYIYYILIPPRISLQPELPHLIISYKYIHMSIYLYTHKHMYIYIHINVRTNVYIYYILIPPRISLQSELPHLIISYKYIHMSMMFTYKNYNERVSQNLYSIHFHTDQPKRYKYKKI